MNPVTPPDGIAKQLYIKKINCHAHDIGLIVNPNVPFLGATPDASVCVNGQTGILEIKCHFSVRDLSLLETCQDEKYWPKFFLKKHGNELKLDT
ncbi:hypothetical protein KUTeg_022025 [Tegillarca granosa]|uniref:YqaJ viral recombinase domain-containing protein n=1 Tax=Tegillarca granosa TaxID=220873 RepID=A0ABQ9E9L5_TEGGR|nr:hypothetical protein KUTeg_022025 [Tegillarca granosa]